MRFPFLIHVAKSEKRAKNLEEIEKQTSLPIKRALKIQNKIKQKRLPNKLLATRLISHADPWYVSRQIGGRRGVSMQRPSTTMMVAQIT